MVCSVPVPASQLPRVSHLAVWVGCGGDSELAFQFDAMTWSNYEAILKDTMVPEMPCGRTGKVLLKDNHIAHDHAVNKPLDNVKIPLGIRWEATIPTSPDPNLLGKT